MIPPSDLRPPHPRIGKIICRFEADVPALIGHSLLFGFIFGGFAKGYATWNHDIDMLVCLQEWERDTAERFRQWYLAMHEEFGLPPDHDDPGEVLTIADLVARLSFLERTPLRREIETYYEYESILWADVIAEAKVAIIGDKAALESVELRCKALARRWRSEVARMLGVAEDDSELAQLDLRRLFKRVITYLKKDPPSRLANKPPLPRRSLL